MEKERQRKYRKLIISSIFYFVILCSMTTTLTYAWFTITNTNNANLVTNISEIEAEYEFFIYQNTSRDGSDLLTLIDNTCEIQGEDMCYLNISNPNEAILLDGSVAPGERYSFAIRITSVNNPIGTLKLELGDLVSEGYDRVENKIQQAFYYQVDKISYVNFDVETDDIKDEYEIMYHSDYFLYDNDSIYPLVSNVPMKNEENVDTMIVIYFNLYFDPYIYGVDEFGFPYTNSNIFLNQSLAIQHIYMSVSTY
ncbi:MAG: hypothetical protein KKH01_05440 [Firmicutes bacterium]|nr:hypothetical protein [Bacillota bacterium]